MKKILPLVNFLATLLSPILEKRNAKKNAEAVAKGELPKVEVSAGRVTQIGGTGTLLYIGYELIQMGEIPMGTTLIIIGSLVGLAMEYLKIIKESDCEEEQIKE